MRLRRALGQAMRALAGPRLGIALHFGELQTGMVNISNSSCLRYSLT